jgi:hypothetical protein
VSPLKSCRVSMVFVLRVTTELSSLTASSTIRRLGDFFLSSMAVLKSFFLQAKNSHEKETAFRRFGGLSDSLQNFSLGSDRVLLISKTQCRDAWEVWGQYISWDMKDP